MCDEKCPLPGRSTPEYRVVGPGRRDFLAQSLLAAIATALGAGVLGACGDGEIGGVGPLPPPVVDDAFTIRIADFPVLQQVGGVARIDGNTSNPVAVSRLGPNTFIALSMICPHAGYKPITITSTGFRCSNHGALFAKDGDWTGGQRTRDLQSYPVTYNASAGTLLIG